MNFEVIGGIHKVAFLGQELEAYVSDSDSETEWRGAVDMLSPWEQERQRHEREESRRVLLELKSVLGIRTSDGERDKRKLLLFSDQGTTCTNTLGFVILQQN